MKRVATRSVFQIRDHIAADAHCGQAHAIEQQTNRRGTYSSLEESCADLLCLGVLELHRLLHKLREVVCAQPCTRWAPHGGTFDTRGV